MPLIRRRSGARFSTSDGLPLELGKQLSASLKSVRVAAACAFTAIAMVFGGGGSSAPRSELTVELAAAATLVIWLGFNRERAGASRIPAAAALLACPLVLLAVIQLIPLPSGIWHDLPGRDVEHGALALVRRTHAWMPWSVAPSRTLASLLSLGPPMLALGLASTLDRSGRNALLLTVTVIGLLSVLLGALQLSDGVGRTWRFYFDNPGYLNGFQANRNAQVDVLLIALAAGVAASRSVRGAVGAKPAAGAAIAVSLVFMLGCVLTGSRAGIAMIAPVAALAVAAWKPEAWRARPLMVGVVVAALMVAVAVPLLVENNQALQQVASRFTWDRDFRLELWHDTRRAIAAYWPMGSGLGTFKPVFIAFERLAVVDPTRPVRAHNDYLEFTLEAGVFAPLLLALGFSMLCYCGMRAWRSGVARDWPHLVFCVTTLVVIALHSIVDYPLRSMAIAQLAAIAAGMLVAIGMQPLSRAQGEYARA